MAVVAWSTANGFKAAPEEPCDTEVEPAALPTLAPTRAPTMGAHPRADARDVRGVRGQGAAA